MPQHPIEILIARADAAINREDFDSLLEFYAEDAMLVVKPGMYAVGKTQIRKAFEAITEHFGHTLDVQQAGMEILETDDTALALAKTLISAHGQPVLERKATYVFKKDVNSDWLCVIDNSYGHDLIEADR